MRVEFRTTNRTRVLAALLGIVMLLPAVKLQAQASTAAMNGRVLDEQGGALPGVTVVLRGQETGLFRETVSTQNGTYNFVGMTPGVYQVEAELPGFKKYQRANIRLEVGKTVSMDLTLAIGQLSEQVTVTAAAPVVDVTAQDVGDFVETRELVDLPTATRGFRGYLDVLPGVVDGAIGGQRGNDANFTFDGGNNNDITRGGDQARIPIESIQEFQVVIAQPDASFGSTGGVVNVVSKQGTNEFHGSALTLVRDSALAEKEYFAKVQDLEKPDTRENQYAFSLGGPIIKNKMHAFGTYEQFVRRQAVIVNIPDRPDLDGSLVFPDTVYNAFVRFDHQISGNHTWSARALSEYNPSLNPAERLSAARTAEDHDQQWGGTISSVLGPTMLNTFRVGMTREDYLDSSYAFKDAGGRQERLLPTLDFDSFTDQQNAKGDAVGEHTYLINNTFNWFIPNRKGDHNIQAGFEVSHTTVRNHVQDNLNGTFSFSHNGPFNAADPRSWPDQFSIRVPGESIFTDRMTYTSAYIQDKWELGRLTVNVGVRYELEVIPVDESDNPAFASPDDYPVDANNIAPRTGFAYALDDRSVLRGGWGLFYQRTLFNTTSQYSLNGVYADSFVVRFPANSRDGGPAAGRLPSDPMLLSYPNVNRAAIDALFPPGTVQRNTGTVFLDSPDRHSPYTHHVSLGYERQLGSTVSASIDYVRKMSREMLVRVDLNPGLRVNTSRTGRVNRVDPNFVSSVYTPRNLGWQDTDQVAVSLSKRFSDRYSFRTSYTWSRGRANISRNDRPSVMQVLDDLNLDLNEQPTEVDRTHNLVLSGTLDVPRTGGLRVSTIARVTSGAPFTISDSSVDPDRNGILTDPLPAGTYSGSGPNAITVENKGGIGGARLPKTFQLDVRLGYRLGIGSGKSVEFYGDILNATGFIQWDGISGDRRQSNFLVPTETDGQVRALQIGARFAF
jgi:hypothetical protein